MICGNLESNIDTLFRPLVSARVLNCFSYCNLKCSVGQRIKLDDQFLWGFITRITLHFWRCACPVSNHPKLLICGLIINAVKMIKSVSPESFFNGRPWFSFHKMVIKVSSVGVIAVAFLVLAIGYYPIEAKVLEFLSGVNPEIDCRICRKDDWISPFRLIMMTSH